MDDDIDFCMLPSPHVMVYLLEFMLKEDIQNAEFIPKKIVQNIPASYALIYL